MFANRPADTDSIAELKARAGTERARGAFVTLTEGPSGQRLFRLERASVSIGRGRAADLRLDGDGEVSRLHARFERVGDGWELVDDGLSRNGTFVNEERVRGRRRLADGDALRFGNTTAVFRSPVRSMPARAGEAPAVAPVELSTTQRRVLAALCRPFTGARGFATPPTDEEIAEELFISAGTVQAHLRVLCAKLGVHESRPDRARVDLIERAFATGVITDRDL